MKIRVIDNNGRPLKIEQMKSLEIWNSTISHVCASVLERLQHEMNTIPSAIEKKQDS